MLSEEGSLFCSSLVNLLFSEPSFQIKNVLLESISEILRHFDEDIQELFVNDDGSINEN